MKTQIRKMKLELKEIARQIKINKKIRKKSHPHHDKYIGNYHVEALSIEYRHKHVAYCLVRGRTMAQVDSGNKLDMDYVTWIIKSMNPESKEKLYVVVSDKLSISQQAVQSGHAVAAFLKKYPHTQWDNGHLIYLKDKPDFKGNMTAYGIVRRYEYAEFIEPDVGNLVTAYACFGHCTETQMKSKSLL